MYPPHREFAITLSRELRHELAAGANLVWSPYSVASALGLATAGARGQTYDEIARVLAPDGDVAEIGQLLIRAAELDGADPDAELAISNTLWMRTGLPFAEAYQQEVLGWPGGGLQEVDFEQDPEGVRAKINNAVEQDTHGLIKELLERGSIDQMVAAVIVNALYLKAAWAHAFEASQTMPAPFHAPSGQRSVPTMRQTERFGYAAVDRWQMVSLPAEGGVVMDVLLPGDAETSGGHPGRGADRVPSAATVAALLEAATSRRVELQLPRFRVETASTLGKGPKPASGPLAELGMVSAFDPGVAEFRGMSPALKPGDVYVSAVVHKAVLDVDEKGFEGAAATAVTFALTSIDMSPPVRFYVDRPFYVMIRHARSGAIYFFAHVVEP